MGPRITSTLCPQSRDTILVFYPSRIICGFAVGISRTLLSLLDTNQSSDSITKVGSSYGRRVGLIAQTICAQGRTIIG